MPGEVVPFGKYKGQPVEIMAADADYCEWLTAQPWFRSRYGNVYNILISSGAEPQDSPEHNQMQARFLDSEWCFALADVLDPAKADAYREPAAPASAGRRQAVPGVQGTRRDRGSRAQGRCELRGERLGCRLHDHAGKDRPEAGQASALYLPV